MFIYIIGYMVYIFFDYRYVMNEFVDNDLIESMLRDLYENSGMFDYNVPGSATGRESSSTYSSNLEKIRESVYCTICRSGFARYRKVLYFFTGKIYEPIPNSSYFRRAMKLFLKRVNAPVEFIVKHLDLFIKDAYMAMNTNRVLLPSSNIMAFRNGVVDMSDGVLMPFSKDYHVLCIHDYDYDPEADCPMWKEFLRGRCVGPGKYTGGVLPDKNDRLILQMFLGLGLYDRSKMSRKVENSLVLLGDGGNGKSVIMNTAMGVFGEENVSNLSMEALLRGGDERQRNMSQIEGKVFNWSGEIEAKTFFSKEDAAKSLISGEPQLARRIGENAYKMTDVPFLIFNANHFPLGNDSSFGFFRRFIFIVFSKVVSEKKQNLELENQLKREYPGILNWIMRGAVLLKKNKFKFPESEGCVRKKIAEMGASALGKSWAIARGCVSSPPGKSRDDPGTEIDFAVIYKDIERYAEENGFPMVAKQTIAAHLRDLGFGKESKRKVGGTVYYKVYGIKRESLDTQVPVVSDMDVETSNEGFEYDER